MNGWVKCPQCGKMLPGGAMFCRRCGFRLGVSAQRSAAAIPRTAPSSSGAAPPRSARWIVALVVLGIMYAHFSQTIRTGVRSYVPPQTNWTSAPTYVPPNIVNPNFPAPVTPPAYPDHSKRYPYDREPQQKNVER